MMAALLLFLVVFILLQCSLSATAQQLPINPSSQTIIQPNHHQQQQQQQTTFHTNPPSTIPSFPEQSAVAGCPISLPNDIFPAVKSACVDHQHHNSGEINYGPVHRSRCCPVLAAWLYSAYSSTALGRSRPAAIRTGTSSSISSSSSTTATLNTNQSTTTPVAASNSYEMPMLPDDSEGCVDGLENAMKANGVNLGRPNATCDVVYCYCGIRLHQLSCPASFRASSSENGDLDGDQKVDRLAKDCAGNGNGKEKDGDDGVVGCSKCLNSLYKLNRASSSSSSTSTKNGNHSVEETRTSKMRSRECELMGLTWLLDRNRTAYMHTVTLVLRALMLTDHNDHHLDNNHPVTCGLGRDGMPLPVTSSEISSAGAGAAFSSSSAVTNALFFSFFLGWVFLRMPAWAAAY